MIEIFINGALAVALTGKPDESFLASTHAKLQEKIVAELANAPAFSDDQAGRNAAIDHRVELTFKIRDQHVAEERAALLRDIGPLLLKLWSLTTI